MPAAKGMFYPAFDVPHDRRYLSAFAWFDYIRPKDKDDIFVWRGKDAKNILKATEARKAPIQNLDVLKGIKQKQ